MGRTCNLHLDDKKLVQNSVPISENKHRWCVKLFNLAHDKDQTQAHVNTVTDRPLPLGARIFLTS
jgi:hypothetical protein